MKANNRNRLRALIKSLNNEPFAYEFMRESFIGELTSDTVEQLLRDMRANGEIVDCGKVSIGARTHVKMFKEGELKFEAEPHRTLVRKFDPLAGMRKIFPEAFTDPKIAGKYRFIDNGLRQ